MYLHLCMYFQSHYFIFLRSLGRLTFFAAQLTQDILNKKDYFKYLGLIVQWISDVIAVVMVSALLQPSPMLVEPLKCKHHCAYHNPTRQTSLSCFLQPQKLQLNRKSFTPCHTATEWSNQTVHSDLTTVQSSSKSQVKKTEREKINTGIPSCPTSHLEEQDGAYQARIRTATVRNWAKKRDVHVPGKVEVSDQVGFIWTWRWGE